MRRMRTMAAPVLGATCGLLGLALWVASGCQGRCVQASDCGSGSFCLAGRCETECFTDQDCLNPPECQGNPRACKPRGLRCNPLGQCKGLVSTRPPPDVVDTPGTPIDGVPEGWDDPPGTGPAFIIAKLEVAGQGQGFDLDGKCRGPGDCVDNVLAPVGKPVSQQMKQGVDGGETLFLIELAGLDEDYKGVDRSLTVKFYTAVDDEDPPFSANNFSRPLGETTCCRFKISRDSLTSGGQVRARSPARIETGGRLVSTAPTSVQLSLTIGRPPHPAVRLERVHIRAELPRNMSGLSRGIFGGAIPLGTFADIPNPYCATTSDLCSCKGSRESLLDGIAKAFQPDIDLGVPADGLERVEVGGCRVTSCRDGCSGVGCVGVTVEPLNAVEPWTCADSPRMEDGYSSAFLFEAVAATITGITDAN